MLILTQCVSGKPVRARQEDNQEHIRSLTIGLLLLLCSIIIIITLLHCYDLYHYYHIIIIINKYYHYHHIVTSRRSFFHFISTAFSGAIVVGLSEIAVQSIRHIGPTHSSSFN